MGAADAEIARQFDGMGADVDEVRYQVNLLTQQVERMQKALQESSRSLSNRDRIERIPGRRVTFWMNGSTDFDASRAGKNGNMVPLRSDDGAFVWTGLPVVLWKPLDGPDEGAWTSPGADIGGSVVDLSFALKETSGGRDLQTEMSGPLFSLPTRVEALAEWTLFEKSTTINFTPFYDRVRFAAGTTGGRLKVSLPGFKIVGAPDRAVEDYLAGRVPDCGC